MPVVSIALDQAIAEHHRALGALGYIGIVGDKDEGDATRVQVVKDVQDLFS